MPSLDVSSSDVGRLFIQGTPLGQHFGDNRYSFFPCQQWALTSGGGYALAYGCL